MKWQRKYKIDIGEAKKLNKEGWSLPELSEKYNIPRTTLNRYFHQAGYKIYFNSHKGKVTRWVIRKNKNNFKCVNAWKRALVERFGHKCMICGYNVIIEAHHIVPKNNGGETSIDNGALLCPNHHAETHAGLLNLIALSKSGELLGKQEIVNQQPNRRSSKKWLRKYNTRATKGSTTNPRAKAVMGTRAPDNLLVEDIV